MSSGVRCKNCGSTEIEEDNARGDAVCTSCGTVLEDNLIVSEVQFEEVGHGSSAIGQFVSADSTGGATNYGYGKFQVGSGTESREVTIKKAKNGITLLCQQLQLTNHYMETSLNFFKMALARHLTRGRRNSHIYAACVYITCRTEGTSHLLIDISDVLQICCYELGRTYLKLSNALCINIPSVDPCLYIMRFANKLQFGPKTHEVSMTALRLAQRMKKDSLHSGRRPTGLCGAALLIAARMHEFGRTIVDIVKIVKIHESTIRKRLSEFADTPSSSLTLEEFMAVDLEAEQDPPAFKAARKKDRERIQKLGEYDLTMLQKQIDAQLDKDLKKSMLSKKIGITDDVFIEEEETETFIRESNRTVIEDYLTDNPGPFRREVCSIQGLKPDVVAMCMPTPASIAAERGEPETEVNGELDLEGLDDDEINGYIMSEHEANNKNILWMKLNEEYLKDMKVKEEKLAKEREEGKPEKRRRPKKRRTIGPSNTAGEAIEKMLQEKKISNKINYDILKTLTEPSTLNATPTTTDDITEGGGDVKPLPDSLNAVVLKHEIPNTPAYTIAGPRNKKPKIEMGLPVAESTEQKNDQPTVIENDEADEDEEVEQEPEPEPEPEYSSLKDMLNNGDEEDEYYGYDEDNY